jgi:hypothetical protein
MAMPRFAGGRSLTDLPSIIISPLVTSSSPAIIRSSVDLPQPDGPTKTTNSPSGHVEIDAFDDVEIAKGFFQIG